MRIDTKRAGVGFVAAVAGVLTLLFLGAGPAAGLESGEANASDRSVASGAAVAEDGSVASGSAVAKHGSVSSGCATAVDKSTASGGEPCPAAAAPEVAEPEVVQKHRRIPTAGPAQARRVDRLAFTGPRVAPLAAAGTLAMVVGGAMVLATSDRRRTLATR